MAASFQMLVLVPTTHSLKCEKQRPSGVRLALCSTPRYYEYKQEGVTFCNRQSATFVSPFAPPVYIRLRPSTGLVPICGCARAFLVFPPRQGCSQTGLFRHGIMTITLLCPVASECGQRNYLAIGMVLTIPTSAAD